MTLEQKILGGYVIIATGLLVYFLYPKAKPVSKILPLNDVEQIIVDPVKHELIITTPKGQVTKTLPDRQSIIDVQKDGTVKISSAQFGFEEKPFLGLQASNHFRFMAGSDQFFYKKLDFGLAIGVQPNLASIVGIGQISYNVYNNTRIGVTFDTDRHVGIGITVRL